jgi:hypothetical protein
MLLGDEFQSINLTGGMLGSPDAVLVAHLLGQASDFLDLERTKSEVVFVLE